MRTMSWSGSHGLEWSGVNLLYLTLLLWTRRMDGLADFSNYLSRITTSHSVHACDGQPLRLHCPRHSTISVQAAFYGRGAARFCSSDPAATVSSNAANHSCSSFTALQKLLSECQSLRDCQLIVNHLLFGKDPCPGTTKYLSVTYKCKPTEHKTHVVCEGERLVLHCKPTRVLNIYAAVYGRGLAQGKTCPSRLTGPPPFECLNHEATHTVSQSCYSKQRCVITVDNRTFRDPCFPGTRKYLTVLYSCVPHMLLAEADPSVVRSTSPPRMDIEKASPADLAPPPKGSRLPVSSGVMMSNSLMTFGYIKEHLETVALLFTSSVCVGLLLTLLAVSLRVTCRGRSHRDQQTPVRDPRPRQTLLSQEEEEEEDDDDEEEETDCSLLSDSYRKPVYCWEEVTYTTEAAERVERIERREMVMKEIWMNAYLSETPR